MSKKTRRTKKQKLRRPGPSPYRSPETYDADGEPVVGVAPATHTAAPAVPAYASAVTGPRRQSTTAAIASGNIDVDARVPYFTRDLRRIVVTAVVMISIIVAVSYVVR